MRSGNDPTDAGRWGGPGSRTASRPSPPDAIELPELRRAAIERRLGYFGDGAFVVFGYCPGGGEVIWKDGRSSGFGTGGWNAFLQEFAPLAARRGASMGDLTSAGTHVLLMDRIRGEVYAVPRESAERFLARANGLPPPTRPCLCSMAECAACRSAPTAKRTSAAAGPLRTIRPTLAPGRTGGASLPRRMPGEKRINDDREPKADAPRHAMTVDRYAADGAGSRRYFP